MDGGNGPNLVVPNHRPFHRDCQPPQGPCQSFLRRVTLCLKEERPFVDNLFHAHYHFLTYAGQTTAWLGANTTGSLAHVGGLLKPRPARPNPYKVRGAKPLTAPVPSPSRMPGPLWQIRPIAHTAARKFTTRKSLSIMWRPVVEGDPALQTIWSMPAADVTQPRETSLVWSSRP